MMKLLSVLFVFTSFSALAGFNCDVFQGDELIRNYRSQLRLRGESGVIAPIFEDVHFRYDMANTGNMPGDRPSLTVFGSDVRGQTFSTRVYGLISDPDRKIEIYYEDLDLTIKCERL